MIKAIHPLNDRVLIKPIDTGERRQGSIIIADTGQEKPELGRVIEVGPGRKTEVGAFIGPDDIQVKAGDVVLIPKIGTIRTEIDGEEYYVTQFKEILAKVEYEED